MKAVNPDTVHAPVARYAHAIEVPAGAKSPASVADTGRASRPMSITAFKTNDLTDRKPSNIPKNRIIDRAASVNATTPIRFSS